MARKKKNIEKLTQVDAKIELATTLDELMGEHRTSPYRQKTEEDYAAFLSEMNLTDLQSHAKSVGLLPVPDRRLLMERLTKHFVRHQKAGSSGGVVSAAKNQLFEELDPSIKKILKEGA